MTQVFRALLSRLPVLRTIATGGLRLWKSRFHLSDIRTDLQATRRTAAFLRDTQIPVNGRSVLVLAVDDSNIYGCKLLALASTGLRLRGWRPIVLLRNRGCWLGRQYFQAFGIDKFAYLDDIALSADDQALCQASGDAYLRGPLDLQSIKSWRFDEAWLGPHMISTLSRLRFEGIPDFSDSAVKELLADILPRSLEHVLRARRLLDRCAVDLAIGIEVNYSIFGPIVDACVARGIGVVQLIQPWKDDALIFKRLTRVTRRDHPASVDRHTLNRIASGAWTQQHQKQLDQVFADRYSGKWFLQARNQTNTRRFGRKELVETLGLDPEKPIATVFSHVLWDANLFYGEDLFKDYGDWFVQTVRAACANSRLNWLIKIHPANVWKRAYENVVQEYAEIALLRQHIGALPPHVKILPADTNISTMSLFEGTDYGVTVRGTSGMELPCFGKPCLTAGTGRYSGLGFTIDSATAEDYLGRLTTLHELGSLDEVQVQRAKWHAYTAFILRPWKMCSARSTFSFRPRGTDPLDHNLHLTAKSVGQIADNGDLHRFAAWAEGDDVDYVEQGRFV
ncbi:MAG: hypothetical protein AMS22_00880 [Thiotrichales bacterium SG8_50]|nr:MAG: hypothetical protein AMS22_00880 [Thiotrichales bacterium SG8_50]